MYLKTSPVSNQSAFKPILPKKSIFNQLVEKEDLKYQKSI